MKRAELVALWVWLGLLAITAVLGIAVAKYGAVCFWAGGIAAAAQTVLAFLAWWGLRLARQQAALVDEAQASVRFTPIAPLGTFHMSYADDAAAPIVAASAPVDPDEITSLDTGLQRVIIGLCSLGLLVLAGVIAWLVHRDFSAIAPGKSIIISPVPIDPGAVVAAGGALVVYFILASFSRVTPRTEGYGEAANGIVLLGLPGGIALFAAVLAAWAGVTYASQGCAIFIAVVLLLQALELGVNALRNYGAIEEIDQAGTDLQQLPLVPLLTSGWIIGMRVLLAESIGITRSAKSAPGILARLLPRVVVAGLVILLGLSTLHVVPTGDVGILEHLGVTTPWNLQHPLQAGLHVLWPWPIDKLQYVPTERANAVVVGTEEPHKSKLGPNAFSFWSEHTSIPDREFLTGDVNSAGAAAPQLLDGFIACWWRVTNPGEFFHNVSSGNIVEYGGNLGAAAKPRLRPMDQALVHQVALYAVTSVFARHSLKEIMRTQTGRVAEDCKKFMQRQLDAMHSGIKIFDLSIKDIHPPAGQSHITAQGRVLGPAAAFEEVVSMREYKQTLIDQAQRRAFKYIQSAKGYAVATILAATAHKDRVVHREEGRAKEIIVRADAFAGARPVATLWEFYRVLGKVFDSVEKVVLGPGVTPPEIWQIGRRQSPMPPPPGKDTGGVGSSLGNPMQTSSGGQ